MNPLDPGIRNVLRTRSINLESRMDAILFREPTEEEKRRGISTPVAAVGGGAALYAGQKVAKDYSDYTKPMADKSARLNARADAAAATPARASAVAPLRQAAQRNHMAEASSYVRDRAKGLSEKVSGMFSNISKPAAAPAAAAAVAPTLALPAGKSAGQAVADGVMTAGKRLRKAVLK